MKSIIKRAEVLFAASIRTRGYCEVCGTDQMLQCAHILTRGYKQIAFDEDNALCLCKDHHEYFTPRPKEWRKFITYMMGKEKFASLREKAVQYHKKIDYKSLVERLKNGQTQKT